MYTNCKIYKTADLDAHFRSLIMNEQEYSGELQRKYIIILCGIIIIIVFCCIIVNLDGLNVKNRF